MPIVAGNVNIYNALLIDSWELREAIDLTILKKLWEVARQVSCESVPVWSEIILLAYRIMFCRLISSL